jgi:hypothetical protein
MTLGVLSTPEKATVPVGGMTGTEELDEEFPEEELDEEEFEELDDEEFDEPDEELDEAEEEFDDDVPLLELVPEEEPLMDVEGPPCDDDEEEA